MVWVIRQWRALNEHLGYRGRALFFLAVVWAMIGVRLLETGGLPDAGRGYALPLQHLPLWLRVFLWWAPAALAAVTAFWPAGWTRWGFIALVLPVAFRAASYAFSVLFGHLGDLISCLVWVGITAFVMLLAGWPEPVEVTTPPPHGHEVSE